MVAPLRVGWLLVTQAGLDEGDERVAGVVESGEQRRAVVSGGFPLGSGGIKGALFSCKGALFRERLSEWVFGLHVWAFLAA